jgi:hypothetical protein
MLAVPVKSRGLVQTAELVKIPEPALFVELWASRLDACMKRIKTRNLFMDTLV